MARGLGSLFGLLLCFSALVHGAELIKHVQVEEAGGLQVGAVSIGILHMDGNWGPARQGETWRVKPAAGFPKTAGKTWSLQADLALKENGVIHFEQTLIRKSAQSLHYQMEVKADAPVPTKALAMTVSLPVAEYAGKAIALDGEVIDLPQTCAGQQVRDASDVRSVAIPVEGQTLALKGVFTVYIQDERQFGGNSFTLRLAFTPGSGEIASSVFSMLIELDK